MDFELSVSGMDDGQDVPGSLDPEVQEKWLEYQRERQKWDHIDRLLDQLDVAEMAKMVLNTAVGARQQQQPNRPRNHARADGRGDEPRESAEDFAIDDVAGGIGESEQAEQAEQAEEIEQAEQAEQAEEIEQAEEAEEAENDE